MSADRQPGAPGGAFDVVSSLSPRPSTWPAPASVPLSAVGWRGVILVFGELTDEDLGAIFAYLQTVRPVRHRIRNYDPPTFCPRCGRRHGLGDLNSGAHRTG